MVCCIFKKTAAYIELQLPSHMTQVVLHASVSWHYGFGCFVVMGVVIVLQCISMLQWSIKCSREWQPMSHRISFWFGLYFLGWSFRWSSMQHSCQVHSVVTKGLPSSCDARLPPGLLNDSRKADTSITSNLYTQGVIQRLMMDFSSLTRCRTIHLRHMSRSTMWSIVTVRQRGATIVLTVPDAYFLYCSSCCLSYGYHLIWTHM